jgi:hypothetical protein
MMSRVEQEAAAMSMRAELPYGPAKRVKLIAAAAVAVLLLGALATAPASLLASNSFTLEEQWILGL